MLEVAISALRDNLSRYIRRVRDGEELVVTDDGKAVAHIVPLDQRGLLDHLVAERAVTPPLDRERTPLPRRITPTDPVSPLIMEDRR